MAIERTGARLALGEQISLRRMKQPPAGKKWADFRCRPLTLDVKGPKGEQLRAGEVVAAGARRIGAVIKSTAARALIVIKPKMITNDKLPFSITREPVTVEMFCQFVADSRYKIEGHNANKLQSLLVDPRMRELTLTYVSWQDAMAFVKWHNKKTGREMRIPVWGECLAAMKAFGEFSQIRTGDPFDSGFALARHSSGRFLVKESYFHELTWGIYRGRTRRVAFFPFLTSFSYCVSPKHRADDLAVRLVEGKG